MHNESEIDQRREKLRALAKEIADTVIEELVHKDYGNVFNLEEARPLFEQITQFYREFATADLKRVPGHRIEESFNRATAVKEAFLKAKQYSLSGGGNPRADREQVVDTLVAQWTEAFNTSYPILAYCKALSPEYESVIQQLSSAESERREKFTDVIKRVDDMLAQLITDAERQSKKLAEQDKSLNELLETGRKTVAEVGVSMEARQFLIAYKTFRNMAWGWLAATLLAGLGVYYAISALARPESHMGPSAPALQTPVASTNTLTN